MDELPTRTSGKVDRNALPWPLPGAGEDAGAALGLDGTAAWVAGLWGSILGAQITGLDDDFFEVGGGSLSAAQLVTALRERFPEVTVAQLYDHPRLGSLAEYLDELAPTETVEPRIVAPTPLKTQLAQIAVTVPLTTLTGLQWVTWLAIANNVLGWFVDVSWAPTVSWWWILLAFIVFITPIGRMTIAVVGARLLLRKLEPGTYPRGGSEHLRLWIALRLTEASGAANLSGAPWMLYYARALGADIGSGVDLHTLPPSPACSNSVTAAPSNPKSTSPATGSTATSFTSARSRSATAPPSVHARRFCPARVSVATPSSNPDLRCSAE